MSNLKPCIVRTGTDPAIINQVRDLAGSVGFETKTFQYHSGVFLLGKFENYHSDSSVLHDSAWPSRYKPEWPRFDVIKDGFGPLRSYWSNEPAFDETPLPQTMNEELAEQTRNKFNLSQEQWECIPPLAREALSGAEVVTKQIVHEWTAISDRKFPEEYRTVSVTSDINDLSADNCGIGYFNSENEYCHCTGLENPTHWAELPPQLGYPEEHEEEQEDVEF